MHCRAHRMIRAMPSRFLKWLVILLALASVLTPMALVAGSLSDTVPAEEVDDLPGERFYAEEECGGCCDCCDTVTCMGFEACCGAHCASPALTAPGIVLRSPLYQLLAFTKFPGSSTETQRIQPIYRPPWL